MNNDLTIKIDFYSEDFTYIRLKLGQYPNLIGNSQLENKKYRVNALKKMSQKITETQAKRKFNRCVWHLWLNFTWFAAFFFSFRRFLFSRIHRHSTQNVFWRCQKRRWQIMEYFWLFKKKRVRMDIVYKNMFNVMNQSLKKAMKLLYSRRFKVNSNQARIMSHKFAAICHLSWSNFSTVPYRMGYEY